MKFKHLLILNLSSLLIFSGGIAAANNQIHASSVAMNASVSQPARQGKLAVKPAQSQQSIVSKSGTFVSGEHTTKGRVKITTKEGKSFIELEPSFKTSESGPDLVVILHRSDNVIGSSKPPNYPIKKGDYFIVAPLKKYSGAQTYLLPNNIKLSDYKSVAIWCRRFNATFGAANLSQNNS